MRSEMVQEALCGVHALALGILLMAVYDGIRIVRTLIPHGKGIIGVEDFAYWMTCAVCVFRLLYGYNHGVIRWFVVLGVFVGMVVYQNTIGGVFVTISAKFGKKITNLLKNRLKSRDKRSKM